MLLSLWLPIVLSAIALFFASFLSWMMLQIHKHDWRKLPAEDKLMDAVREMNAAPGNYMFPACETAAERSSPEHQKKWEQGPRGVVTLFGSFSMGQNLALTFAYFLVVSFCIAYLASVALPPSATFLAVFRFVSTAGLLTFLSAIVQHAIWFRCRIVGHVIESVAYAAIIGVIFAGLWPA
ncbi:MAG: hypothetical protein HY000_17650 [Planctomycetes bacterium]|nr:hypothetical protein [Planctomycetota bacterium]